MRETLWEQPILSPRFYNYVLKMEFPKVAIGIKRLSSLPLSGLRFYVLGTFGCTAAAVAGKKSKPNLAPQAMVEKWNHDLGGTGLTSDNAKTILRRHSKPHSCFFC